MLSSQTKAVDVLSRVSLEHSQFKFQNRSLRTYKHNNTTSNSVLVDLLLGQGNHFM